MSDVEGRGARPDLARARLIIGPRPTTRLRVAWLSAAWLRVAWLRVAWLRAAWLSAAWLSVAGCDGARPPAAPITGASDEAQGPSSPRDEPPRVTDHAADRRPAPPPAPPPTPAPGDALAAASSATRGARSGASRGVALADLTVNPRTGIDSDGWFHAPAAQPIAPRHVLTLLADLDLAEAILSRGQLTRIESLEDDHIIFKADLTLAPEDARRLGRPTLRVAFKPAARGVYGKEHRRERLYYLLGRRLGLTGLIPIVERRFPHAALREQLTAELTPRQLRKLRVIEDDDGLWLHGSVQLWVEGYRTLVGHAPTTSAHLERLARSLRADHDPSVLRDPMWQALSDMFVLDYVVYNSDRLREGGSVRLPGGGQRLVLLDNGDALLSLEPRPGVTPLCDLFFSRVELFSPNVLDALDALDLAAATALLVDAQGEPLVEPWRLRVLVERAQLVRARVRELARERGGEARLLFPAPSRSMQRAGPRR